MLNELNRQRLDKLLAMTEADAYQEMTRLYAVMPVNDWEDLCDEYALSRAEINQLNKE